MKMLKKLKNYRALRPFFYKIKKLWMDIFRPPSQELLKYCAAMHKAMPLMEYGGMKFVRMGTDEGNGKDNDGGYVMSFPLSRKKIAYSIGISNDVSWDNSAADYGYDVYMYDHTINSLPFDRKEFHWQKKGLSANTGGDYLSLPDMLEQNGHSEETGMLLKIDIENAEWNVFPCLEESFIKKFDQIAIELHKMSNISNRDLIIDVLSKITRTHAAVHIHANNCGRVFFCGKYILPDTLEVTFLSKDLHDFTLSNAVLPRELDFPNCKDVGEIVLGRWNG